MHTIDHAITVGQAASRSGVTPKAIRLYEARGLLTPAQRTRSGYRSFSQRDVDVLCFIRQARRLGLTLLEIKEIIDLQQGRATRCEHVLRLLDTHIREIDRAVTDLVGLRQTLMKVKDAAVKEDPRGESVAICPIIENQNVGDW